MIVKYDMICNLNATFGLTYVRIIQLNPGERFEEILYYY